MVTKSIDIRRAEGKGNDGDGLSREITELKSGGKQGGVRLVTSRTTVRICGNVTGRTETETGLTCDTGT